MSEEDGGSVNKKAGQPTEPEAEAKSGAAAKTDDAKTGDDRASTKGDGDAKAKAEATRTDAGDGDRDAKAAEGDEAEAEEDEEEDEDDNGKRKPVVEIEESIEAERATQVAAYQADEKPPSVQGAIVGGMIGSLIGAVIWWGLIRVSGYELGLVAIGVGILAGLGVVRAGGRSSTNQIIGAVCGLVGILLGRILFYYFGFDEELAKEIARQQHVSVDMAKIAVQLARDNGDITLGTFMKETMQAMDILFFGIGMFEGWRIPRPQT